MPVEGVDEFGVLQDGEGVVGVGAGEAGDVRARGCAVVAGVVALLGCCETN